MDGLSARKQRVGSLAPRLAQVIKLQARPWARRDGIAALQIGKGEGAFSVTAVSSAQKREQGGVLRDRHELARARAQPRGAKLKGTHMSEPRKGSIRLLVGLKYFGR